MAAITNPQALAFVREKVRPLANLIKSMRRTNEQFMVDIVSGFEAHTSGNANGDTIDDGAAAEGKQVLTKGDILACKFVVEQLKACMETDDRIALNDKAANNGLPLF